MRALVNPVVLLCGMAGMFSASVRPPTVLPGEVRNPELADVDPSLRKGHRLALAANRSGPSTASNKMWIESLNVRDEATSGVRKAAGIRRGAISGNMKVSFQAARSI